VPSSSLRCRDGRRRRRSHAGGSRAPDRGEIPVESAGRRPRLGAPRRGAVGLLSGRYPTARVYHLGLRVSLVETLQKAGFATAAFTERGYFNPHYGLHRGFDTFVDRPSIDSIQRQEKMRRAVPAAASQHAAACMGRFGKTGEGSAPLPAR
jgi:hypothetical protein